MFKVNKRVSCKQDFEKRGSSLGGDKEKKYFVEYKFFCVNLFWNNKCVQIKSKVNIYFCVHKLKWFFKKDEAHFVQVFGRKWFAESWRCPSYKKEEKQAYGYLWTQGFCDGAAIYGGREKCRGDQ